MTVTYTSKVATTKCLGCFLKLLARWRGSIYKLVWLDLLVFLFIYYSLNCSYRWLLNEGGKRLFADIVGYCYKYGSLIPLSFVLGFYVSIVMARWWNQYVAIPSPDSLAVFVSTAVHGQDERGRMVRRTIMRYVCLCITMTFTMISPRVKKRFPNLDDFVEAGLLQQSELEVLTELDKKFPEYPKQWLPIIWGSNIVTRAHKEDRIKNDYSAETIIAELNKIRGKCDLLLDYNNISIPLVYTQVVTLAVYSYFFINIMAHQWVHNEEYFYFHFYFPVITVLQCFFYVGWLKVAESLINPFGDDDDDFEINWMVDRNLQVSYLIVDKLHHQHPELVKDQYWDEVFPQELPYTTAAKEFKDTHLLPSTVNITVIPQEREFIDSSSLKIDDMQKCADRDLGKLSRGSQYSTDCMYSVNSITDMLTFFSRADSKTELTKPDTELNDIIPRSKSFPESSVTIITDKGIMEANSTDDPILTSTPSTPLSPQTIFAMQTKFN